MITGIEIRETRPFVGGAAFGDVGAYVWISGVATGEVDPARPANAVIAGIELAPRNGAGRVEYRSDFVVLRPADKAKGNGRLLYEVNNRGRKMIFASLCAGAAGNVPQRIEDCGSGFPLERGFTLVWSGWDPGAPRANGGLALEAPAVDVTRRIREEFVSGTRLGTLETFWLSYDAVGRDGRLTVRRTQTCARRDVPFEFVDSRSLRLLPVGTLPEPGSIYEFHYMATRPRLGGLGFAATRDLVAYLRHDSAGHEMLGGAPGHALAFGISQAGRYLRDHIALGFNRDEDGQRVFDGVHTHVAGIGRVFHNALFAQPARTRTWHEDHDFPEVELPFSASGLLRGDEGDPKLIETNTSTEYWQKGASLLHTDPDGTRDAAMPPGARGYLIAGTQHAGKAGVPRDPGPCRYPRNWHDPMPAVRALLVALDEWVSAGREPPPSRLPRIDDGTLVSADALRFPAIPDVEPPRFANDAAPLSDWVDPAPPVCQWRTLVPQVDGDGNETAGIRLLDIAVPTGTHTGWNLYAPPYPAGELADRDGSFFAFAATREERERSGDPRLSLAERYPGAGGRSARIKGARAVLRRDGFLLAEEAAAAR